MKHLLATALILVVLLTGTAMTYQQSNTLGYGTPFQNYMAPVATGPTAVTALTGAFRIYCNNTTGSAATVTFTDTAGVAFVSAFSVPANSDVTFPPGGFYMKMVGVKSSTGTNNAVNCLVEGYTP